MSGTPAVELAMPAPLTYTASNPALSTCRAIDAFGTPGIITVPGLINSRRCLLLLLLILLLHHQRRHQLIDVRRFIQFPRKIDNLLCARFAQTGDDQGIEFPFQLFVAHRI